MAKQATLVLIKPDGLKKSLTGNILTRLSYTKLIIIAAKMATPTRELAMQHYYHLRHEKFFSELIDYFMGKYHTPRVMAMIYYGDNAIEKVRELAGATNPEEADPVSIRGSYGRITTKGIFENVIHASTDTKEAKREIQLWFEPQELTIKLYPTKEKTLHSYKKTVWA